MGSLNLLLAQGSILEQGGETNTIYWVILVAVLALLVIVVVSPR